MRKIRNLHLWIGLFTSLLILIEAVTGLLMLEPWLMGAGRPQRELRVMVDGPTTGQVPEGSAASQQQAASDQSNSGQASGRPSSGQQQTGQQYTTEQTNARQVQGRRGPGGPGIEAGNFNPSGQGTSFAAFVKGLHSGRINGTDISILLDIVAISLIFMTVTGMILTVRALKR